MHVWLWDCRHKVLTLNNPIRRNLMALNHTIQGANSDHRNERVQDQEMSRTVIESFHRLVETTSISFNQKELCYRVAISSTITVSARPASFSKKYGPMMPPGQNPHLWMHLFFANHTWVLPNTAILPINKTIEMKMCVNISYKIFELRPPNFHYF